MYFYVGRKMEYLYGMVPAFEKKNLKHLSIKAQTS